MNNYFLIFNRYFQFLSCADCDVGPIGYHDLETKKSYVALGRVHHAPV